MSIDQAPQVRPATERDLDELGRMGDELAHIHHDFDRLRFMYGEGFEAGYRRWFEGELTRDDVCIRVAEDDGGRLAGYVYGRLEGKDWNALLDDHAGLHDLLVVPHARQRGTGEALVRAFCKWADERGVPRVVLSTASGNVAAQRLFASLGFRATMVEMTREQGA